MSEQTSIDGAIIVDKPEGITSFDVIRKIRKKYGVKKIGHAGTLDPLATGVLILLCGKATKMQSVFLGDSKMYQGLIRLGVETDSDDITGEVKNSDSFSLASVSDEEIERCIESFTGEISQVPPAYSAIKIKGKKSYELARKGQAVEIEPRNVTVHALKLERVSDNQLSYEVYCSKGTYVRALARDIGRHFGTYGCVETLRRTASMPFRVSEGSNLDEILESNDLAKFAIDIAQLKQLESKKLSN